MVPFRDAAGEKRRNRVGCQLKTGFPAQETLSKDFLAKVVLTNGQPGSNVVVGDDRNTRERRQLLRRDRAIQEPDQLLPATRVRCSAVLGVCRFNGSPGL